MSVARHHADWLSLVESSGPFLSMPVLLRVFPQGLEQRDPAKASHLREAYEDWLERGAKQPAVHHAWIRHVLTQLLEYPPEFLVEGQAIPPGMEAVMANFCETLRPDFVLKAKGERMKDEGKMGSEFGSSFIPHPSSLLLIEHYGPDQDLEKPVAGKIWKASPGTRMMELLHAADVPLGLVTNGEQWMIVSAPRGETTGFASWYADLWMQEPITLRAFHSLLHLRRFLGVAEPETLAALYAESSKDQQEVTDQLGYQVRQAVEMLVQAFDRIDAESGRKLLADVSEKALYDSALTVMMRLVFLFSADERGMLLLGDPLYDQHYAVSTLSELLRERADQHGEEVLERRHDAWCRLLATFRAVHGGVEHEAMRLPPYGGTLFDPDRFPFLEGRPAGTRWRTTPAKPLPINNRVVLHLLEALQVLRVKIPGGGNRAGSGQYEARRLSFRALDIEQIGHVYEGLLDHTAKRARETILGLAGSRNNEPEIPLSKLEELSGMRAWKLAVGSEVSAPFLLAAETHGNVIPLPIGNTPISYAPPEKLVEFLVEETRRSAKAISKALLDQSRVDENRLLIACGHDRLLLDRIWKFAALIRLDTFGFPVVIPEGSVYVTSGNDRRSTGTHYTPRSLTEPIVQHTLEPLVYIGPAEGLPKAEWKLKSPREILALKVCDMAMGSGAFLVQTCRYLGERLVEAWEVAEIEMRGAGTEDRENPPPASRSPLADTLYEHSKLSGTGSVESEHGPSGTMLPGHQIISEGGTIRVDQPDSAGRQLSPGEYRGGPRTQLDQGISESPEHRARLAARSGNPPVAGAAGGTAQSGANPASLGTFGTHQSDALAPPPSSRTEANLISLPAPRSSPPVPQPLLVMPDGSLSTGNTSEYLLPLDDAERLTLARRYVADRCLYGVDINPMAVEMAKLSLWLITLQRDRPFTFLDHALKCGDSLLGVSSVQQIENFSLRPGERQVTFATANLFRYVEEATAKRRALEDLPSNDHSQIETKTRLHAEAEAATAKVKAVADCLSAFELRGLDGNAYAEQRAAAAEQVQLLMKRDADESVGVRGARTGDRENPLPATRSSLLEQQARENLRGRRPFHWPVEFPEVFARGGFDAFVGNPPFQGGHRITGSMGTPYRDYLVNHLANGKRGHADLCSYFLLRAGTLLSGGGNIGFIATNTISQGDSREVGLDFLTHSGFSIFRAVPSRKWPGAASLEVAHLWLCKNNWSGHFVLDDYKVEGISPFLTVPSSVEQKPYRLAANQNKSFQGSKPYGQGFVLQPHEAQALLNKDARNADVIFPYLIGEDLNSRFDQSPSRYVINFFDWLKEKAQSYEDCWQIIEQKVKPERQRKNPDGAFVVRAPMPQQYWIYGEKRPALYSAIAGLKKVLVVTQVSKFHSFTFVPAGIVYDQRLIVLVVNGYGDFAHLQSTLHRIWILAYGSTLETRPVFTPSDCFDTFPFPGNAEKLASIGKTYFEFRQKVMDFQKEGFTDTYNRFHNRGEQSAEIARLRALHVELDQAVAAAYGWSDLDLGHGFHSTKQGERYTLSETARRTVLDRLLALNHHRYAEELKAGLHDKGAKKSAGSAKGSSKTNTESSTIELF